MAGADGKIHIDTEIDKSGVKYDAKDIEREMENMGKRISKTSERYNNQMTKNYEYYGRSVRRVYRGQSEEARRMHSEMRSAYMEQRQSLYKYKDELIGSKYAFFQLGKAAKDYTGTSKQFMGQVEAQGRVHKKVMDEMIKNNEMMKVQLIQSVGQMITRTTQATRIMENFDRMKNPLYQVNKGALAVASGLNQIAMRGQPAALALKMLGPTANMKQLKDMTMMISQGIMRMTMVALVASVTAVKFYSTLHKGAMESNKAYAKAFAGMKKSVRQAFEPLFQVFAAVMIPVFNFIKKIADLTTEFNKAHPKIAKFVAAIILLVPALMLILAPLAAGIGLFAGFQAALGAAWMLIGPLITGLAAMSGTVWLVAAAIVALVSGFIYLKKTGQSLSDVLLKMGIDLNAIGKYFVNLYNQFTKTQAFSVMVTIFDNLISKFVGFGQAIQNLFKTGDFTPLLEQLKNFIPAILGIFVGGIPRLLLAGAQIVQSIAKGMGITVPELITKTMNLITEMITKLASQMPKIVKIGVEFITKMIQGVVSALPQILAVITKLIDLWLSTVTTLLPMIIESGVQILLALIQGFSTMLPAILTAAIQIIMALVDGIVSMLPTLIDSAIQIIMLLVATLVENLPKILEAGIQILMALIDGIIEILPVLLEAGLKIIMTLLNLIVANLPKILDAGVKILMALIQGVIKILPKLIAMALKLIITLAAELIKNLPKILKAGGQILWELVKGIGALIWELLKLGGKLIWELIKGIDGKVEDVKKAAGNIARKAFDTVAGWVTDFFGIGKSMGDQMGAGFESVGKSIGKKFAKTTSDIAAQAMSAAKINIGGGAGVNGSHKLGLDYVPFDGYVAELHKGERVLTADEARLYNAQEKSGSLGGFKMPDMSKIKMPNMATAFSGMTPATAAAAPVPTQVEQPVSITFTGNIFVRNDDDIKRVAEDLGSQVNRGKRRLDR